MSYVQEIGGTDVDTDRYSIHLLYTGDVNLPDRVDVICRKCKETEPEGFFATVWTGSDMPLTMMLRSVVRHEISRHRRVLREPLPVTREERELHASAVLGYVNPRSYRDDEE